jgi:hypothetical protein
MAGDFLLSPLDDPGMLQYGAIKALQERLGGTVEFADPNNAFLFQMEYVSSLAAGMCGEMYNLFSDMYLSRAITMEQLYRHMSDYDYTHIVSKPATIQVQFQFDRDYLFANALDYNDDYKKVIIPELTTFSIGAYTYGIYYPIEIRINKRTGNILVSYDVEKQNRLNTLSTNTLDDVQIYSQYGLNVLALTFPVYQFTREMYYDILIPEQGFVRQYNYTDKFYAVRVFTGPDDETWTELTYTLSDDVYDRDEPTAKIAILADVSKIQISIPQIYFTKGLMSEKLKVEIYTTHGEIDIQLTQSEAASANCEFNLRDPNIIVSPHSEILAILPTKNLIPMQTSVSGGSNGLSFEELKRRIISGTLYDAVPITPMELENTFKDKGFSLLKSHDGITDRIYFANRRITGGYNGTIPITTAAICIDTQSLGTSESIRTYSDTSITILPTSIFLYAVSSGVCTPINDSMLNTLKNLSRLDLCAELNTHVYTRQPFHICIYPGKIPITKSYNLMNPETSRLTFIKENVESILQATVVNSAITHLSSGTGGYNIKFGVEKSSGLKDISEDDLAILIMTTDRSENKVYLRANYVGKLNDRISVYETFIYTDYHITHDGYIRVSMLSSDDQIVQSDVQLTSTFTVHSLISSSKLITPDDSSITFGVPNSYNSFKGMTKQSIAIKFGDDLSSGIYNKMSVEWSPIQYAKHSVDVYHTYSRDQYMKDESTGLYVMEEIDGVKKLILEHRAGDAILDSSGAPVIKNPQGSYKHDALGQPIQIDTRHSIFYIDALQVNACMYASEHTSDVEFMKTLSRVVTDYVATVTEFKSRILESTDVYFRPTRSIGTTSFNLGDGKSVNLNIDLSFEIKFYVPIKVLEDANIRSLIENMTVAVIERHVSLSVISMTDASKELKSLLGDNVTSIDIGGINGTPSLQTLMPTENGIAPMVKLLLTIREDGRFVLKRDIKITFVSDT